MSIFSKLSGTMERVFMLGKRGIKLSAENNELQVKSNDEASLVPVSGANPLQNTHFVTLEYFNNHGGGGGSSGDILKGTADPTPDLGSEGSVYFKVNGTIILAIYIKDGGIWKIYQPTPTHTNFKKAINVADWNTIAANQYEIAIQSSEHNEGINLIVGVFENTIFSSTSTAPYRQTLIENVVEADGRVILKSTSAFSGEVIISGK